MQGQDFLIPESVTLSLFLSLGIRDIKSSLEWGFLILLPGSLLWPPLVHDQLQWLLSPLHPPLDQQLTKALFCGRPWR
ncbi:hypothetical protein AAFF_G00405170 [Aldrovandia affinis]|uniref:Uncharacterized protein n=1 Tax=Aldrovandia affinis TaxID=143900 RepID=A0AAD7T816_9TELE|nr:hypothetical protein AAFF_G00405170 [Aldrovandia affinis]